MTLVKFASSQAGRSTRALAGIVLIVLGLLLIQGTLGFAVAIVGLVPLAAGLFDACLFAPLAGAPLKGSEVRATAAK